MILLEMTTIILYFMNLILVALYLIIHFKNLNNATKKNIKTKILILLTIIAAYICNFCVEEINGQLIDLIMIVMGLVLLINNLYHYLDCKE